MKIAITMTSKTKRYGLGTAVAVAVSGVEKSGADIEIIKSPLTSNNRRKRFT